VAGPVQEGQLPHENKRAGGGWGGGGGCLGGRTPENFCDIFRAGPDDTRPILVLLYEHKEAVGLNLAGLVEHPRVCLDLRFRGYNGHAAFFALIRLQHLGIVDQPVAGHFRKPHAVLIPKCESRELLSGWLELEEHAACSQRSRGHAGQNGLTFQLFASHARPFEPQSKVNFGRF